jgi:DNA primase
VLGIFCGASLSRGLPVSFTIDADTKERVRAATDIVDLVGGYLELRRQGRAFVALCPWHRDRRPSLQVNPERQIWKCWVCDIGGDAFNFVMQQEGITFPEAVKMLAERAGIVLEPDPRAAQAPRGSIEDKKLLYRVMEWAAKQYQQYLQKSGEADQARAYLADRSINPESIAAFELGMAPEGWSYLIDRAVAGGFNSKQLEAVGLCARSERGSYYDRFRNRIMFPIRDSQKRVIAFGGRVLPGETDAAKYINSPETVLFTKNQHLYGLDRARDTIRQSRQAIVMEGYTDVIIAHQCGLTSAVAVLGTALGTNHLKLLRHLCDSVVLVLDGDEAGQRRSDEVLELFLTAQMDVRVLTLPDRLDPADYLLQNDAQRFLELTGRAPDALEFKMRRVCDGFDPLTETHRANSAIEEMLGLLAKVPRAGLISDEAFRLRQNQILANLSRRFSLPESALRERLGSLRDRAARTSGNHPAARISGSNPAARTGASPPAARSSGGNPAGRGMQAQPAGGSSQPAAQRLLRPGDLTPVERELLELVISAPALAPLVLERVQPEWLESQAAQAMLDAYQDLEIEGHALDFDSVLLALEDPSLKSLLVTLAEQAKAKEQYVTDTPENRLRVLTQRMGQQQEERRRRRQLNTLQDGGLSHDDEMNLLSDMIRQARQSHGLDNIEDETSVS